MSGKARAQKANTGWLNQGTNQKDDANYYQCYSKPNDYLTKAFAISRTLKRKAKQSETNANDSCWHYRLWAQTGCPLREAICFYPESFSGLVRLPTTSQRWAFLATGES
jgi:hypothetical protein